MKSIISFEHCFFFKFCYHLTLTKFFLPHLLTLISSVTFLLFFISCNITSNFLATLLLSLIYPFPVSPSSLLLLIKFFGPVKVYIGLLQSQCAFSRCCLMVNIQIFSLSQLFLANPFLVKHLHLLKIHIYNIFLMMKPIF